MQIMDKAQNGNISHMIQKQHMMENQEKRRKMNHKISKTTTQKITTINRNRNLLHAPNNRNRNKNLRRNTCQSKKNHFSSSILSWSFPKPTKQKFKLVNQTPSPLHNRVFLPHLLKHCRPKNKLNNPKGTSLNGNDSFSSIITHHIPVFPLLRFNYFNISCQPLKSQDILGDCY